MLCCVCFRIQKVWWWSRSTGLELITASLETRFLSLKWSSKTSDSFFLTLSDCWPEPSVFKCHLWRDLISVAVREHGKWSQSTTTGSRTRSPPSSRWRNTVGRVKPCFLLVELRVSPSVYHLMLYLSWLVVFQCFLASMSRYRPGSHFSTWMTANWP